MMLRPTFPVIALVTVALPGLALADSRLDRMETLSAQLSEAMYAHVLKIYPQAEGALPDPSWNDAIRTAAVCTLDAYEAEIGNDGVDTMLDEMEKRVAAEIDDFEAWLSNMEYDTGLTDDQQAAIEKSCGMAKASTDKMMSDPNMPNLMKAMGAAMGG